MPSPTDIPILSTDRSEPKAESAPASTPVNAPLSPSPVTEDPQELEELRGYMLGLINTDRERYGLSPVSLGDNSAAQQHAEDKLVHEYGSHWGRDGLTPYMRYTLTGGFNYEAENGSDPLRLVEGIRYRRERPRDSLKDVQEGLMNSPGHRMNILNPWHKKVNLGIACDDFSCSVVQQFEGDYVEFSEKPRITNGTLRFNGELKEGFVLRGVQVWYHQPPHPLSLGQLDSTYSYNTGQQPATFLREPLTGRSYYPDSTTSYIWEAGIDPYSLDPNIPRTWIPPAKKLYQHVKAVRWTTATVWRVSGASFEIQADISDVIADLGPGVYIVILWGDFQGESVPLTRYSIFLK